ncbi:hypothetical protein AQUCO_00500614v1 [Aquilegia coerulea]|uniref:Uncharacterized protein n=1 Tax=Aquilegia coerulea TaxID=218851 RepID=A0A2G5ESQ9_AQUCA|nr:hypothetical protein AQUCO_00500614v1 [Aquilegia coerulea]
MSLYSFVMVFASKEAINLCNGNDIWSLFKWCYFLDHFWLRSIRCSEEVYMLVMHVRVLIHIFVLLYFFFFF